MAQYTVIWFGHNGEGGRCCESFKRPNHKLAISYASKIHKDRGNPHVAYGTVYLKTTYHGALSPVGQVGKTPI